MTVERLICIADSWPIKTKVKTLKRFLKANRKTFKALCLISVLDSEYFCINHPIFDRAYMRQLLIDRYDSISTDDFETACLFADDTDFWDGAQLYQSPEGFFFGFSISEGKRTDTEDVFNSRALYDGSPRLGDIQRIGVWCETSGDSRTEYFLDFSEIPLRMISMYCRRSRGSDNPA